MNPSAREIADNASFQAFMNCYLREIDAGVWHSSKDWQLHTGLSFNRDEAYVLELQLGKLNTTLAIGVTYRSLVGRHTLTDVYQQQENPLNWQPLDYVTTCMLLVNNIYRPESADSLNALDKTPSCKHRQLELMSRMIESHQVMTRYIEERHDDPRLQSPRFIDSEQSILFGHWLHPTPKSRQGIHEWQHQDYTPELCGKFPLHYFAVDRSLLRQGSILEHSAEEIISQFLQRSDDSHLIKDLAEQDKGLLPTHPLQAQWLLHQPHVIELMQQGRLIDLGAMGPLFTPTSSVRTLYCDELAYMIKLSIPVKITNSLRINMQHELDAGMVVANLLKRSEFSRHFPKFQTIDDPAYITVDLPGMLESGFECILRENPFSNTQPQADRLSVQCIAALVQAPITAAASSRLANIINTLATQEQRSPKEVSLKWFDDYFQCAIATAIHLYDKHGIALEAHQQNSLLDVSDGYPSRYFYRDNQGFYLSQSHKEQLLKIEPRVAETADLFYADEMICDRFSYYLIINQLFSVINRMALDGFISERQLLAITYDKLQQLQRQMHGVGRAFIESVLNRREIPCKGNLLTRIDDVDELQAELELAVYTQIKNPLHAFSDQSAHRDMTQPRDEVCLESA